MRFAPFLIVASAVFCGGGCSDYEQAQEKAKEQSKKDFILLTNARMKMAASVPVPALSKSAERQAVARRATTWNSEDKLSYVYLIDNGRVVAFYVARGKVSSLNSFLADGEPDIDGTYGHNVEGVFFFTDTGAYVEWNGRYICSDQPLKVTAPPLLVRTDVEGK